MAIIQFKIFTGLNKKKAQDFLPNSYKKFIALLPKEGTFSLIFFSEEKVILSRMVKKALKQLTVSERTVAIGYGFTQEGKELFNQLLNFRTLKFLGAS